MHILHLGETGSVLSIKKCRLEYNKGDCEMNREGKQVCPDRGAHSPEPTVQSLWCEAHSMESMAWSPQRGAHSVELKAWSPQHGAHSAKPVTWSPQYEAHGMQATAQSSAWSP